jgi:hypothetical protein
VDFGGKMILVHLIPASFLAVTFLKTAIYYYKRLQQKQNVKGVTQRLF